jgi:hypothetical protein
MVDKVKLLIPLGIILSLIFLLSVRKPWGRVARRFVGNGILVCFIAAIIGSAVIAYIILLTLPESAEY